MSIELEHVITALLFVGVLGTTLVWASRKKLSVLDFAITLVIEIFATLILYACYRLLFVGHL